MSMHAHMNVHLHDAVTTGAAVAGHHSNPCRLRVAWFTCDLGVCCGSDDSVIMLNIYMKADNPSHVYRPCATPSSN
jgi:hypothetical protein